MPSGRAGFVVDPLRLGGIETRRKRDPQMFEFDAIDRWGPSLASYLGDVVPAKAYEFLRDRKLKYFEEYRDVLFRAPGVRPGKVITATGNWLSLQPVIAYHGSRLTPAEIENVILKGLEPLHARRRINRLRLIFSRHPNWFDISSRLSEVIDEFGAHGLAKGHGLREGFVHAAISRDSLINCFDRYLTYGSEFDQMIALTLVGRSGLRLLASYGQAVLFRLRIPPAVVIKAANPYPGVGEKIPRPIGDILYSWARWVVDGACSNTNAGVDCGLRFDAQIPPNWIVGHEILDRSVVLNASGLRKSPAKQGPDDGAEFASRGSEGATG